MTARTDHSGDHALISLTAYLTLVIVGIVGVLSLPPERPAWLAVIFLLIIAGLMLRTPRFDGRPAWKHIYLALQTVLIGALLVLDPHFGVFPILFFVISAQAMLMFPIRTGLVWVLGFTLITGTAFVYGEGWLAGILTMLAYATGYLFFGIFGATMQRADMERQKSDALLEELQATHSQLQEYLVRAEDFAVAEERNRLAREMHDAIGHRLTVAAVQLEGAQRLIPADPQRAAEMIATVRGQVREALDELRITVATLRQPLETDLSLPQSLQRLIEDFQEATAIAVHTALAEDLPELPDTHRLALYRTTQEALTNIQRHAHAQQVWLELACQDKQVTLLVRDDGEGFPANSQDSGFGLRGMRERAAQLGGSLAADNSRGGAQVRLSLPLAPGPEHG